ncbi:hypothetical protein I551_4330 [Mycobacterium ulcerans str. Harvey]|uniref:Uncharacterized protein n=1 Tax=Mycobacterium ulcerans str. Harvey TaxID=1299332 RepID=A0ABN0QWZ0_MYCUL|nr:hypothetical protein I551_4330 [Mycobacterium ulcerans str. Harvey]
MAGCGRYRCRNSDFGRALPAAATFVVDARSSVVLQAVTE